MASRVATTGGPPADASSVQTTCKMRMWTALTFTRTTDNAAPHTANPQSTHAVIDTAAAGDDHTRMPQGDTRPDPASPFPPGTVAGYFSRRENVRRAIWYIVEATFFRWSFRRADRWRSFLLRCFGARVGKRCLIRRSAHIEIPWHVTIGDDVMLGEQAIVYSLGPIVIGDRTMISPYVHLCGGSHDHRDRRMTLLRVPVTIGSDVWIAADAFIGPGVNVGDGTIVGARSSVFKDLPAWKVCHGNPARVVREREFDKASVPS